MAFFPIKEKIFVSSLEKKDHWALFSENRDEIDFDYHTKILGIDPHC